MRRPLFTEDDKGWLSYYYTDLLWSTADIGKMVGCSKVTIYDSLQRLGIEVRKKGQGKWKSLFTEDDKGWLNYYYTDLQWSTTKIGEMVGYSGLTIIRLLRRLGIKVRKKGQGKWKPLFTEDDREWLNYYYVNLQWSDNKIGEMVGLSAGMINDSLRKLGIRKKTLFIEDDRGWLNYYYTDLQWSTVDIGEMVGCNKNTINNSLRRLGIKVRKQGPVN